ncbi:MAG: putative kinesin 14-Ib protein, partial [Streblomastix strix]
MKNKNTSDLIQRVENLEQEKFEAERAIERLNNEIQSWKVKAQQLAKDRDCAVESERRIRATVAKWEQATNHSANNAESNIPLINFELQDKYAGDYHNSSAFNPLQSDIDHEREIKSLKNEDLLSHSIRLQNEANFLRERNQTIAIKLKQLNEQAKSFFKTQMEQQNQLKNELADERRQQQSLLSVINQPSSPAVTEASRKLMNLIRQGIQGRNLANSMKLQVSTLQLLLGQEFQSRRKLHNELQRLRGNIRVLVRVRPMFVEADNKQQGNQIYEIQKENQIGKMEGNLVAQQQLQQQQQTGPSGIKGKYSFDRVFSDGSTQEEVYLEVQPLVTSFLDGFNVCIAAYGQTGTGKTYTMQGQGVQDIGQKINGKKD